MTTEVESLLRNEFIKKEVEYELSVKLKIPTEVYEAFIEQNKLLFNDVIFYYPDFRIVNTTQQKKIVLKEHTYCSFTKYGIIYPFTLTISNEYTTKGITKNLPKPTSVKFRKVFYYMDHLIRGVNTPDRIRIGLETQMDKYGGDCYFVAEMEMSYNWFYKLDFLKKNYGYFWDLVYQFTKDFIGKIPSQFDPLSPADLTGAISRKFCKIYDLQSKGDIIVTAKYDGVKMKLIYNQGYSKTSKTLHYSNDVLIFNGLLKLSSIPIEQIKFMKNFPNIVFQCEEMVAPTIHGNGIRNLILVDVVGGYKDGKCYKMFPDEALTLIESLKINNPPLFIKDGKFVEPELTATLNDDLVENKSLILDDYHTYVKIENLGIFRLCAQSTLGNQNKFYPVFDKIDGYLIICGCRQYKMKVPTIDVEVRDKYIVSLDIVGKRQKIEGEDGIYEITLDSDGQIKPLRKRSDRAFASSQEEYKEFLKEYDVFTLQTIKPIEQNNKKKMDIKEEEIAEIVELNDLMDFDIDSDFDIDLEINDKNTTNISEVDLQEKTKDKVEIIEEIKMEKITASIEDINMNIEKDPPIQSPKSFKSSKSSSPSQSPKSSKSSSPTQSPIQSPQSPFRLEEEIDIPLIEEKKEEITKKYTKSKRQMKDSMSKNKRRRISVLDLDAESDDGSDADEEIDEEDENDDENDEENDESEIDSDIEEVTIKKINTNEEPIESNNFDDIVIDWPGDNQNEIEIRSKKNDNEKITNYVIDKLVKEI